MPIPVSVVVPTKNEAVNLSRCLERLAGFDEIVVVDSGSEDATCSVARSFKARVVDFRWNGQFPKKRNWTLRNVQLRNEWVLFIDADEYVSDEFKAAVAQALPHTTHAGFWLTYENRFLGRRMRHGDKLRKLALFRRGRGEYERIEEERWTNLDMEVHEHPVLTGTAGRINAPILHEDFKGLSAYLQRHNAYSDWEARRYLALSTSSGAKGCRLTARQRIKYRLMDSWLLAPAYFVASYGVKFGFLDGREGFVFAALKAQYFFQIKCKIVELRNQQPRRVPAIISTADARR